MKRQPTILFVAMPDSIHAARWITQLEGQGWDLHLFPSRPGALHPLMAGRVTFHEAPFARLSRGVRVEVRWPMHMRGVTRIRELTESAKAPFRPARRLARLIERVKPDLIYTLEFQHAAYLALEARSHVAPSAFPPWAAQNWGNDIFFFGRFPEHAERIRRVLAACDYYDCECERDVRLAREFGFKGEVLPVLPNAGGYPLERLRALRAPGPTSARRLILLKGYQGWQGRALVGVEAIRRAAPALKGYRIGVFSARTEDVHLAVHLASQDTGIPFDIIPPSSQDEIFRLHGRARASIGLNITDGISISVLEAMVMGSLPIQSDTGSAEEWVRDGVSGFIVRPEDPAQVAEAIVRAATDDRLVDEAAAANWETARQRLDEAVVRPQVIANYRKLLGLR